MITREQFYKSKQWEAFRKLIINQRTDEDGYVHCCECGKPILHKYDLIIHHKQELTEANVNDAMVALNPDNVECICFRCHNKVHERFGFNKSAATVYKKHVYIVYGAPCSGKTTWVHENATPDDLVVDLDSIWQMISINERYDKPAALKHVVFEMRDKMYDIIRYRSGKWHSAFIITGGAMKGDRDRLAQRVGADDLIFIDTDQSVCLDRMHTKGLSSAQMDDWKKFIIDWFERYQSD
jgi:hypothetical protein